MIPETGPPEQSKAGAGHLVELATNRIADVAEGMHHAIARPWFSIAGPRVDRLHRAHQASASGIYGLVRIGGMAAAAIADRVADPNGAAVDSASAVASALWGDDSDGAFRSDASFRDAAGKVLHPSTVGLEEGFPDTTGRIVVLFHGLGQTERCWDGITTSLGSDSSIVRIRYNTGLPISTSAGDIALLLDQLVEYWPVDVDEVTLVGYSMGGLVARAAVNLAHADNQTWVARARHVITAAAPLLGSPIEKGAEACARALAIAPQTRPLADFVSSRSQGIKDLRHGSAVDDVLPDHVEHHCVAAVVTKDSDHVVAHLLGDLVVRAKSATGRGRQRSIEHSSSRVLGGRNHANVLDAPELLDLIGSVTEMATPP